MKTRKHTPIEYPFVQATPFGKVKIYRQTEGDRTRYTVSWSTEEGRQRKNFDNEVQAHQRAEEIIEDYKKGVGARSEINSTKALRIVEYEKLLEPFNATLGDAVRFYITHRETQQAKRVMAYDAVTEYLNSFEVKEGRNYETARSITQKFSRHFRKALCDITVKELDTYLKSVSDKGRTRNNHLGYLKTFFRWAQKWHGYLEKGEMEIDKIPQYPEEPVAIEVFTPEEITTLLNAADDGLRPYLALGAFAGIRCAEISRLQWENIDLENKVIELGPKITKTKRRRLVTMPDNLVKWLAKFSGEKVGPVMCGFTKFHKDRSNLCEKTGVVWKDNGLRKSYISYRMAQPDWDAAKVAKQCGNSVAMVEENYKGLVLPKSAEAWFSV